MAAAQAAPTPLVAGQRKSLGELAWPIGTALVVVALFIFYQKIVPNMGSAGQGYVQRWLSLSALNEMVIYVIMALGLNVVVGYAGLLDLGYVAFWAIGTYTAAWLMSSFIYQRNIHIGGAANTAHAVGIHINFWLVLVIGAVACAISGVLIGATTLRLKSDYLALVTLGFGEIVPQFFKNGDDVFGGHNLTNGSKSITPIDSIGTGLLGKIPGVPSVLGIGQAALPFKFLVYAVLAGFCLFVSLRIRVGRLGRSWLAIREDELAASMMGVPLVRSKLAAYAVGAVFGGLGGVAYATFVGGALAESFGYAQSITVLIMVVLGGMGNVWGVMIGALALAWLNNTGLAQLGAQFNSATGAHFNFSNYNFLIFGLVLVLMMLFRREGLLPERRTRQILAEPSRMEMESMGANVEAGQSDELEITELNPGDTERGMEKATLRSDGRP